MPPETPTILSPDSSNEQPIVPGETTQKTAKDNHWLTITSMAVFVILSLAATIFLYSQNKQLKKIISNSITPSPIATPSPTPNPTANWKTYTDNKYNFSIKYPPHIATGSAGVSGTFANTPVLVESFSDPKTVREGTDAPFDGFTIWFSNIPSGMTFEKFIDNELKLMSQSPFAPTDKLVKEPIKIGDLEGYAITFSSTTRYHYFPTPNGKSVIEISRMFVNQEFLGFFDQTLSSFKFFPLPD